MDLGSVSIVIVNFNGLPFLRRCLASIASSEAEGAETIVLDNASTDGSPEMVKTEFPDVRLIELKENMGFAAANNVGVRAASGKFVHFLNSDTVVEAGWLGPLLAAMDSDASVGVAGSKLLLMDGRVNSAGADIIPTGGAYDIGFMDEDSDKYNIAGYRGAVCAASAMVRREEFLSLGGFDPLYFMYFEDVDLCWRYWLSGRKVIYVPASVVHHVFGASSGQDRLSPFRVFYGYRNSLFNALKNFGTANLLKAVFLSAGFHAASLFSFLLRLRPESAFAVIRAYGSLFRHMPETLRKRRKIQRERKILDAYLFERSLIVSIPEAREELLRVNEALRAGGTPDRGD